MKFFSLLNLPSVLLVCCINLLPTLLFAADNLSTTEKTDPRSAIANPVAGASRPAKFVEIPATRETLNQIRTGGFVLYLRHGYTDNSRPDRMPNVNLNDCSTQRPLTDEGRKLARNVGEAMRKAAIPLDEIRISPLCRVKETAAAAFPAQVPVIDETLMYTANLTSQQKAPILARTRHWLSAPVAPGKNRVIIAHAPNLMDLIGYFPKEATLVVFRPQAEDGFKYIASIPPGLWPELLR